MLCTLKEFVFWFLFELVSFVIYNTTGLNRGDSKYFRFTSRTHTNLMVKIPFWNQSTMRFQESTQSSRHIHTRTQSCVFFRIFFPNSYYFFFLFPLVFFSLYRLILSFLHHTYYMYKTDKMVMMIQCRSSAYHTGLVSIYFVLDCKCVCVVVSFPIISEPSLPKMLATTSVGPE